MILPPKEKLHLYLLIGQSNMVGRAPNTEADRQPHPRIVTLTRDLQWTPAADPLPHEDGRDTGVGLAMTFARLMAAEDPDAHIGLIPCAVGTTALSRWVREGDLHQKAVARTRTAMAVGVLKGILWHQGESDSVEPALAATYLTRAVRMMREFREELNAAEVPLLIGELGEFLPRCGRCPWHPVVNAALRELVGQAPPAAFVSAEGLAGMEDCIHFDADALREFGRRYAAALIGMRQPAGR